MTARLWLAALVLSAALSPARALEASATLVSGVEPRPGLEARASDPPLTADKRDAEVATPSAEIRRAVRVVLPSPYAVQIPSARP
jgi:hypothetical protein